MNQITCKTLVLLFYSNWGTEKDDSQYHNGNSDPRGFGNSLFISHYDIDLKEVLYLCIYIFYVYSLLHCNVVSDKM